MNPKDDEEPMPTTSPDSSAAAWRLPVALGPGGSRLEGRPPDAAELARRILEAVPGERPLRPRFGWRAHFLSALESPAERVLAAALAERALAEWAPELGVERVEILAAAGGRVHLEISGACGRRRLEVRWRGAR
jgi:phage baseplate assembly protein W